MKILHCADVHLGSKMDSRLPAEKARERRMELRSSFLGMVEYAKINNVAAIIIAGDLFDSDRPLKKDKEFFYNVVKSNPQTDFLYMRGNHDALQSYTRELENLKYFSDKWTAYRYGNVVIYGAELTAGNYSSLYSSLAPDEKDINIAVLHGNISDTVGMDKIALPRMRDKNIDYLALGHYHTFQKGRIDGRGEYCYSGCLEGRGFDEAGAKGFVMLDITDRVRAEFVRYSCRTVNVYGVDVTGARDDYQVYNLVKGAVACPKSDIVRVIISGEVGFDNADLAAETQKRLMRENFYCVSVKDKTFRKLNLADYEGDATLAGEFVRLVLSDDGLDGELKRSIISVGLKALSGREID